MTWIGFGKMTSLLISLKCELKTIVAKTHRGYTSFFCPPEIACNLYKKIIVFRKAIIYPTS